MLLPACATIVNGTSQTVAVSTSPPGAACTVDRAGARVGAIPQTPGSLWLEKSKNNLTVTCGKAGFQTASMTHAPSFSMMTVGNVIAGGLIGIAVDAVSGANYEYPTDIRMDLASSPEGGPPLYTAQVRQLRAQQGPQPIMQQAFQPTAQQAPQPVTPQAPWPITQQAFQPTAQQAPQLIVQQAPQPVTQQAPQPTAQQAPQQPSPLGVPPSYQTGRYISPSAVLPDSVAMHAASY